MSPGKRDYRKLSREERQENALCPCASLGYDRDSLALYFIEREAFALAETQLKRAMWLNPFEPASKNHLAWCLYKQDRFLEARERALMPSLPSHNRAKDSMTKDLQL